MRNCDLSDTLATSRELPPLLSSTAELVFLPIDQDSGRIQADMDLVVEIAVAATPGRFETGPARNLFHPARAETQKKATAP